MKKGFTLIELIIVMVVVGVLVTVALPKYNASLERGRALEAITNLKIASDYINTRYVMNGNAYNASSTFADSNGNFLKDTPSAGKTESRIDFLPSHYFSLPKLVSINDGVLTIRSVRDGNDYQLTAISQNGDLREITCTKPEGGADDYETLCANIGMEKTDNVYKMTF